LYQYTCNIIGVDTGKRKQFVGHDRSNIYSRFVIRLCSLSVFSAWALTRFTIRHAEILAVDDAILIIFVGGEIYVAHLKNVIHDFFNYW